MFAFTKNQRALNEIERRRGQATTYTERLPRDADDLKDFLSDFYRNIMFKRQAEMKEELLLYPNSVGKLYNELVPAVIPYEDFWQRYYYRTASVNRVMAELEVSDAIARRGRAETIKGTWSSVAAFINTASAGGGNVSVAGKVPQVGATVTATSTDPVLPISPVASSKANQEGSFLPDHIISHPESPASSLQSSRKNRTLQMPPTKPTIVLNETDLTPTVETLSSAIDMISESTESDRNAVKICSSREDGNTERDKNSENDPSRNKLSGNGTLDLLSKRTVTEAQTNPQSNISVSTEEHYCQGLVELSAVVTQAELFQSPACQEDQRLNTIDLITAIAVNEAMEVLPIETSRISPEETTIVDLNSPSSDVQLDAQKMERPATGWQQPALSHSKYISAELTVSGGCPTASQLITVHQVEAFNEGPTANNDVSNISALMEEHILPPLPIGINGTILTDESTKPWSNPILNGTGSSNDFPLLPIPIETTISSHTVNAAISTTASPTRQPSKISQSALSCNIADHDAKWSINTTTDTRSKAPAGGESSGGRSINTTADARSKAPEGGESSGGTVFGGFSPVKDKVSTEVPQPVVAEKYPVDSGVLLPRKPESTQETASRHLASLVTEIKKDDPSSVEREVVTTSRHPSSSRQTIPGQKPKTLRPQTKQSVESKVGIPSRPVSARLSGSLGGYFKTLRKAPSEESVGFAVDEDISKTNSSQVMPPQMPTFSSSVNGKTAEKSQRMGLWYRGRRSRVESIPVVEPKSLSATPVAFNKVRSLIDTFDKKSPSSVTTTALAKMHDKPPTPPISGGSRRLGLLATLCIPVVVVVICLFVVGSQLNFEAVSDGLCAPMRPGHKVVPDTQHFGRVHRWEAPWWVPKDTLKSSAFSFICGTEKRVRTVVELTVQKKNTCRLDIFKADETRNSLIWSKRGIQSIQVFPDHVTATVSGGRSETLKAPWQQALQ